MATFSYYEHDIIIAEWVSAGLKLGLLTAAPAADGSSNLEPVGANGYARQTVTLAATTRGTGLNAGASIVTNSNAIVFGPAVNADWTTVTHAGLFDNAGNLRAYSPLPSSRTCAVGDGISIGAGSLQFRLR